jgi:hypothetical protein
LMECLILANFLYGKYTENGDCFFTLFASLPGVKPFGSSQHNCGAQAIPQSQSNYLIAAR